MSETSRSIGGEGLEQGGPGLGNDISRKDLSIKNAGDALTNLPTMSDDEKDADLEDDELELDDDSQLADDELAEDDGDDVIDDDDTALIPDGEEDEDEEDDKNL